MSVFFSIIIPTYNRFLLLNRAINSVLKQSFDKFEIIVVDDYSTDQTESYFKNINNPKIIYKRFKNVNNIGKLRNIGIRFAKSEWIAFLDSDDLWDKDKLLICYKNIIKYNYDLFYHGVYQIKNRYSLIKKKIIDKSIEVKEPIFENLLINGNAIANSSVVVKKSILYEIALISEDKKKFSWEDFDTWLRIAKLSKKFYFINEFLAYIETAGTEEPRVSTLNQTYKNYKNFKHYYNPYAKKKFNKNFRFKWIDYHYALINFKKKKYKFAYILVRSFRLQFSKIGLIVIYIKLNYFKITIYKILLIYLRRFKKVFRVILLYKLNRKKILLANNIDCQFKLINSLQDLTLTKINNYYPNNSLIKRFQNGDRMAILYNNNKILTYGWISNKNIFIDEINVSLINISNKIILYDFFTFEDFRNKGYYNLNIINIINFFKDKDIFIYVDFLNTISKKTILKNNFILNKILFFFSKNKKL